MDLAELYRPLLLDHARNPRHAGRLEPPALHFAATNPRCGDELELYLTVCGSRITVVRHATRACSVCTASASLMSEWVSGRTTAEAAEGATQLAQLLTPTPGPTGDAPREFAPLLVFRSHPARLRCVLLPWEALREALATAPQDGETSPDSR